MDAETTLGYFWLPNLEDRPEVSQLPSRRVAGTLSIPYDRPWKLDVLGSLLPSDHLAQHGYENAYPRMSAIHGFSSRNSALCLYDTQRSSFSMFSALLDQETWRIGWYTEGSAWLDQDEIVGSVTVEYDILWEWTTFGERSGLEYNQDERTVDVPAPEQRPMSVRGAELIIQLDWEQVYSPYSYNAQPDAAIEIVEDLPLNEVRDRWVVPLQTFLRFMTMGYVYVDKVTARPRGDNGEISLRYNLFQPSTSDDERNRDLGTRLLATPRHLSTRGLTLHSVLSCFLDLLDDDDHRTALWLLNESNDRLHSNLVDTALLNAFRSMERYHAAAIGGTAIPKAKHRARVKAVVDNSPEEHTRWAREQLSRANRKTQQRQLLDVLECATDTASRIMEAWPDFFDSIVDLRGKIAHGIPHESGDAALRYLSAAMGLQWIMRHVYLRELGLSDHQAAETVAHCIAFDQELRLLESWYQQLEHP